jgi:hypothetical protein
VTVDRQELAGKRCPYDSLPENDCHYQQVRQACQCVPIDVKHRHNACSPIPQGWPCCRLFVRFLPKTSLTPLPLSLCKLQSAPAADIKIDIETVEKLIGEIIVQPLR